MKKIFAVKLLAIIFSGIFICANAQPFPFQNKKLSTDERIKDLVGRLSLQEKVNEMLYNAPGKMPFTTPSSEKEVDENKTDIPGINEKITYPLFKINEGISYK